MRSATELLKQAEELGEKVNGHPEFVLDALPQLVAMLGKDQDANVLVAAIDALGLAWDERACLAVVPYSKHSDRAVRLSAVQAMGGGLVSAEAIRIVASVLIDSSRDVDSEIRDWAMFELGSILDIDSEEVREGLRARLHDSDYDVKCEALVGLAKRGDPLAFQETLCALGEEVVSRLVVEAAAFIGDSRLTERLERLGTWWDVDEDLLKIAKAACGHNSTVDPTVLLHSPRLPRG